MANEIFSFSLSAETWNHISATLNYTMSSNSFLCVSNVITLTTN